MANNKRISDFNAWTGQLFTDLVEVAREVGNLSFKGTMAQLQDFLVGPMTEYSVDTSTAGFTAAGAVVAGANNVTLNLTGTLGAGAALTLPIATDIVAAIPNARIGKTYRLRIINRSGANFAWTVTTNTGITLTGTMTIAQNTYREFDVTLDSLTAVSLQSLGQVIIAA